MKIEQIVLSEKRKVTLTAYLQETGGEFRGLTQRPCILILPMNSAQIGRRIRWLCPI